MPLVEGTSSPLIRGCRFLDNISLTGGALEYGSPTASRVEDCLFSGNSADPNKGYGGGLGLYGTLTISNCVFHDCTAARGGGLCVSKSSAATLLNRLRPGDES